MIRRRVSRAEVFAIDLSLRQAGTTALRKDYVKTRRIDAASYGYELGRGASDDEQIQRLEDIAHFMVLRWQMAGSPKYVAIEQYAFGAEYSRAHALGEVGGMVKVTLRRQGCIVRSVWASSARKLLLGYAPKVRAEAKKAVRVALEAAGFEGNEDELDSLVVGNWLMAELGFPCLASNERKKSR